MRSTVTRVMVTAIVAIRMFGGSTSVAQDARDHPGYLERAQSGTLGEVRVSAAALSSEESNAVYGSPLADKLIQPVWIEVENNEDVPYWLMFAGLDPNFFPASEAAEAMAPARLGPQARGAGSPFQRTGLPESCSSRGNSVGLRAHEPARGREAPADRLVRGPA